MIDDLEKYSILPVEKNIDPRTLLYQYPSMPVVKYAKLMQQHCFNQALAVAEEMAHKQGYVLLPSTCMHWERVSKFGNERRVKVGRNTFYLMRLKEMTKGEIKKIEIYIEEEKS